MLSSERGGVLPAASTASRHARTDSILWSVVSVGVSVNGKKVFVFTTPTNTTTTTDKQTTNTSQTASECYSKLNLSMHHL